jgi:rubrerythrin
MTRSIIKKIKGAIHEEKEAVRDYKKDAKKADPKTKKLLTHIAKEEAHHKVELGKRLTQLKKEK